MKAKIFYQYFLEMFEEKKSEGDLTKSDLN